MLSTNKPMISVLIPSHNMGEYLPLAVNSVLAQDYENIEVIIIDDGSVDHTEAAMQQYKNNKKVKYIKQKKQGCSAARNNGIKVAKGEFIAFCDADDLWAKNKLELQMPLLLKNPKLAVVASNVTAIDEHGNLLNKKTSPAFNGDLKHRLILENPIAFGTSIIRKSCLDDVGYFDENLPMGVDWDLWLRISIKYNFLKISESTYFYRYWPGQMSNNYEGRYDNADKILQKHFSSYPKHFSQKEINLAYADSDIGRALHKVKHEGYNSGVFNYLLKGIKKSPFSLSIWRKVARTLLKRA